MLEWISYLAAGVIAGSLAGLFGVGGGLVIVPILLLVFSWQQIPLDIAMHLAIGTSLMTICVTSLSSMNAHHRLGHIEWSQFRLLAPGLMIGSFAGAWLATNLSGQWLQTFFAIFTLLMAIRLWLPDVGADVTMLLSRSVMFVYSVVSGGISALVGIGGGTLIVPYLMVAGVKARKAVGTSAACGFPIAASGAVGFMLMGSLEMQNSVAWQTGFIHWQAFIGIIMTSIVFAPLGANVAKRLPEAWLKRLFSLLLLMVGLFFLLH